MNVLIAFTDGDAHNPFVRELKIGLEQAGCTVVWSLTQFWERKGYFDIIHLQWPEYLFKNYNAINHSMLVELEEVLGYWKERARILVTRHNEKPHNSRNNSDPDSLYNLVYSYCDGVVHLGSYQIEEFKEKYCFIKHHKIIPHHIYTHSFPNQISNKEARRRLNIPTDLVVVLIFGRIRFRDERVFLKKVFRRNRRYFYLIPTWFPAFKGNGVKSFLKSLFEKTLFLRLNKENRIRASDEFIKDEEVQMYFNAADIVLIPRVGGLNSGIPTLSYLFKKVVVGPRQGNIGVDLHEFRDPVYIPGDIVSLLRALDKGIELAREGKGETNYQLAIGSRDPMTIGKMHKLFYKDCIKVE